MTDGRNNTKGGWARRFSADRGATAGVEMALLAPVAVAVLALVVYGGEGFSIQRKVTLATRTVADLIAQTPPSSGSGGAATLAASTLNYDMSLAALIVYPYSASALTVEASEIEITGTTTGVVVWSQGYNGGVARTAGAVVTLSPTLTASGSTYLILSELQYQYQPVVLANVAAPLTISESIFMAPRAATQISINASE